MAEAKKFRPGRAVAVAALGGAVLVLGSQPLQEHLNKWESGGKKTVLVVYPDKLANGIPTICDGLTRHVTKTPIVVGEAWTQEKCDAEQAAALEQVQLELIPCFKKAPPQGIFDMASSHAWNFGSGKTCGSGAMVAWNRGEWIKGCQRISRGDDGKLVWSYSNGVFIKGLANRREDETLKCLKAARS